MANQEHLDILKQGVEVWNKWRQEHPDIRPDLQEADLHGADLSGANLTETNLIRTNFKEVNLTEARLTRSKLGGAHFVTAKLVGASLDLADLFGADLNKADLSQANLAYAELSTAHLIKANLTEANLSGARFYRADLSGTNLSRADLSGADLREAILYKAELVEAKLYNAILWEANLSGAHFYRANLTFADLSNIYFIFGEADLSQAIVGWTRFNDIDLRDIRGLDTVDHRGPSSIGIDTIYRSKGNIPEAFLKGAGVNDTFITYVRSLVGKPIEYYSCFLSYSSKDDTFARRLYADLQSNNVRCWFAPEDLKWGERIRSGIDEAIRMHDKLLLVLSKSSVASGWVEREVKTALAKEHKEKRTILFPVRVDKAVLDCPYAWATEIRHERNMGDFTRWKNHDDYQKAFSRLLRDLKAEP
jgi:uncharacterized protein YjbI with pentapeptide repeats